jgi:hypothetical protein
MEQDVRADMVRLAGRIREAGDELHDLCVELADNIARTDPNRDYLSFIIGQLEKSDDSVDVAAHLVACGVEAIMRFDDIDDTTTAMH